MKLFADSLYEIWGTKIFPIELSQFNTFDGSQWLIAITNFMNLNIFGLSQPILLRYPTPSVITFEAKGLTVMDAGWILENTALFATKCNYTWPSSGGPSHRFDIKICAAFDLRRLTLQHKPWNRQLRVDIFPPHLVASKFDRVPTQLLRYFERVSYRNTKFRFPYLYAVNVTSSLLSSVLVGPSPVFHISVFPHERWKHAVENQSVIMTWTDDDEYKYYSRTANIAFFVVDLIVRNVSSHRMVYAPGTVRYVNKQHNSQIVETDIEQLSPHHIFQHVEQFWTTGQSYWSILALVEQIEEQLKTCDPIKRFREPLGKSSAGDVISLAMVHVWQSIFKNYSYTSGQITCSNGKQVERSGVKLVSVILLRNKRLDNFLHIPMQIRDPFNGHFRFVVCGKMGSEGLAFRELVIAYDNLVCICMIAMVWKILLLPSWRQVSKTRKIILQTYALGRCFSIVKIVLEQGDLSAGSMSIANKKTRIFLGIILMMFIILSNGYKNVNVYKMILPRKVLRYERFSDLIHNNFSIYVPTKFEALHVTKFMKLNWFSQTISTKRVSNHAYDFIFRYEDVEHKLLRFQTIMSDIVSSTNAVGLMSKEAVQLDSMAYFGTQAYVVNILANWVMAFKRQYGFWKNLTEDHSDRVSLLLDYFSVEFEDIERKLLFSLINNCQKTALVVPSTEAESYVMFLTAKRGNAGNESYFQQYLTVDVIGLVTPPFLQRLARMKESGIVEWWTNVSEYISLVQIRSSATTSALRKEKEERPTEATLQGNIVVIFALLLGGLGLATVGLICEFIFYVVLWLKNILGQGFLITNIH